MPERKRTDEDERLRRQEIEARQTALDRASRFFDEDGDVFVGESPPDDFFRDRLADVPDISDEEYARYVRDSPTHRASKRLENRHKPKE